MGYKQATIIARTGIDRDEQHGGVVPPIYLSSTFSFAGFNQQRKYNYSRHSNPSREVAQQALAELEGGAGALLTASGMAALHLLCTCFLQPGDRLLAPHDCYGGSYRLLNSMHERGCFQVEFVDQADESAMQAALARRPRLVLIETPSNPLLRIVDITSLCHAAKAVEAITVVDNTFLTPALQNPLALGADIVLHSCTKYLNGHSDIVAGAVVARDEQLLEKLTWWANNIGVNGSAFDSYLLLRGLRTLLPRITVAQNNAQALVAYLQQQPLVKQLYYPSLVTHAGHTIARRQQRGFGAMLSFELDDRVNLPRFLQTLQLFTLAESLGGFETLISHSATMTHAGMAASARVAAGISDSLLRISVGMEDVNDLLADLDSAFALVNEG